jgi:hypothetical protein
MSFTNPTALRVGAKGTLHGWTVTVAGRVVLGVETGGERYYWSEYNLVDAQGNTGTLVYEEGDAGPEWKLFQLLPPQQNPLTVSEAETKRVGDRVSFGGPAIPVTLVDRSRVYHIEGTPPEGVEVGDLADFFNADAGDHMIVASWTGNEIEFYEGRDVPAQMVASAFSLPRTEPEDASSLRVPVAAAAGSKRLTWIVLIALAVVGLVAAKSCFSGRSPFRATQSGPRPLQPAAAQQLAVGASGAIGDRTYLVGGHALVEVGRVGGKYQRREYALTSGVRESALLVNGLTGGTRQWHLLRPATAPAGFSPYAAAAQRKGARVTFDGAPVSVMELFLSQTRSREGTVAAGALPADLMYGFLAANAGEFWLARWTEQGLTLHRGTAVEEKIVLAAFPTGPAKAR